MLAWRAFGAPHHVSSSRHAAPRTTEAGIDIGTSAAPPATMSFTTASTPADRPSR
jgi:hypothetical protein